MIIVVVRDYQMYEVIGVNTTPINSKIHLSGCLLIVLHAEFGRCMEVGSVIIV